MPNNAPRSGSKLAEVNRLLRRPNGATLAEINTATQQEARSYKKNGTYLAKRYGGTYGTNNHTGAKRRFSIKQPAQAMAIFRLYCGFRGAM